MLAALVAAPGAFAKDGAPAAPKHVPGTVVVKFEPSAKPATAVAAEGDRVAGKLAGGVHVVRIGAGETVAGQVAEYQSRPDVVYAEPSYVRMPELSAPSDPSYGSQWALPAVRALSAWTTYPGAYASTGVATPKIAIVDTGVHGQHPELFVDAAGVCANGACSTATATDPHGHGTHVAGIAAAAANNDFGVAGLSFSSRLVSVDVFDSSGSAADVDVAAGIAWATARGVRVINMSLGGAGYSQTLCDAVAAAVGAGVVVVAAAGNDGTAAPSYPAACPGAIGVAATDFTDGSPDWSNYGTSNVFVSAPGDSVLSTLNTGGYGNKSGTSMASPYVAGLAALLVGQKPARSPAEVKRIIAQTARKVGETRYPESGGYVADPLGTCAGCTWHAYYGYGLIDAQAALAVEPITPTIQTLGATSGPAGSTVTLTGTNFTGATSVSLNFTNATFGIDSPTQITAFVPSGVPSNAGRWRVTTPTGTAVHDTVFSVANGPPTVWIFSPSSGPEGTLVTLGGTNFDKVTQVSLGNIPTTFTVESPTVIKARVPVGAAALPEVRWRVHSPTDVATHPNPFTVTGGVPPAPAIASFAPASGEVGSWVTLTGTNFAGATQVTLGNVPATFILDSPTRITARVPSGLAPDGYRWRVTTPGGTGVNDALFTITVPTTTVWIFSPNSGLEGAEITLGGTNFVGVTQVSLGNIPTTFVVDSPTQIRARVPVGAAALATVRWRVHTATEVAVHPTPFTVTGPAANAATIASFAPGSGPVGSSVTLTGANFVGVTQVSLGGVATTYTVDSPTQITAQVPAGLPIDGYRWRVTTPSGVAVHDALFQITVPVTTLASFAPASGAVGSSVTLTGTNLAQVTQVTLGNVNAPFALVSPTQITATVPAGAAAYPTVRWRVHWTGGGVAAHDTPFVVSVPPAPTLTAVAPASGYVGSQVVLTGTSLADASQVTFGNVPATFTIDSATQITATVPAGLARDAYRWRAITPAGTAVLDPLFQLVAAPAPTLTAASPATVWIGTTVTLVGTNFHAVQSVQLGGIEAASFTVVSPEEITAVVPWGVSRVANPHWRIRTTDWIVENGPHPVVLPAATAAYADQVGDTGLPVPDITDVSLVNDADGLLRWEIDVPSHPTLPADAVLWISLRTRVAGGDRYIIIVRGSDQSIDLGRILGEGDGLWDYTAPSTTLRGSWSSGAQIEIDRSELSWTEGLRFQVLAGIVDTASADLMPSDNSQLYYRLGIGPGFGNPLSVEPPAPSWLSGAGQSPKPLEPQRLAGG